MLDCKRELFTLSGLEIDSDDVPRPYHLEAHGYSLRWRMRLISRDAWEVIGESKTVEDVNAAVAYIREESRGGRIVDDRAQQRPITERNPRCLRTHPRAPEVARQIRLKTEDLDSQVGLVDCNT
jgi:hypothetical protein